jgi:ubiquinone/menaquinone biosynthesis C-methylase UbiE
MQTTTFDPAAFKQAQRAAWTSVAEGWNLGIAQSFIPVAEKLAKFTGIPKGSRVLDIATGNGIAAFAAVAEGATDVVASDIAPTFRPIVEQRARELGIHGSLRFEEADAEALPFKDHSFHVVLSQFGIIFAPNRAKAIGEIYRVLRPGGHGGVAVWCGPDMNPGLAGFLKILNDLTPPKPPGTPTILDCGEPGLLEREFREAGFSEYTEMIVDVTFFSPDPDSAWEAWRNNGPASTALASMDEATRSLAEQRVRELHKQYLTHDGGVRVPAKALFVRAIRP